MKAAVHYGPGDLRIEERPTPVATGDSVLLRVEACGICGTDRHIHHGEFATTPPVIIGHEYAGTVVEVGPDVEGIAPGDRVALDPNMPCGVCRPCRRGKIHLCENLSAIGVDVDGGFAEYSVAPAAQCYLLPESVTSLEGALTEPLACCLRGIDRAGIVPGDTVAVIGGGAIGQILAQLSRLAGASRVILSDPIAARREMARASGIDAVINPADPESLAASGLAEDGADVVIEAVGSAATTSQAIEWATPGATIVWFGVTPPGIRVPVEPNEIFRKELTIKGARINPFTHSRAVALLGSGRLQVRPLITRSISLDDLPAVLDAPPGDDVKTVVVP